MRSRWLLQSHRSREEGPRTAAGHGHLQGAADCNTTPLERTARIPVEIDQDETWLLAGLDAGHVRTRASTTCAWSPVGSAAPASRAKP